MKVLGSWKLLIASAGCIAVIASASVEASEIGYIDVQLTEEQSQLLNGYHQPARPHYDMHSLTPNQGMAIPLVALKLTAETNLMKGNTLELGANYRSWSIDPLSAEIDVTSVGATFSLQAPLQKALDFSTSIREKVELCPEKIIDKMLIDAAVGFNYSW